jgi:DNA polymerase-3 subunit delta
MPGPPARNRTPTSRTGSSRARAGGATTASELAAQIKRDRLRPIYLLLGDELILRREALEAIETAVLGSDPSTATFGRQFFAGAESRASDILAAAHGLPMFGERRLVLVDGVDRLRKADRESLLPGLDDLPETTVLVLIADKLDGRLTFTRNLKQKAKVILAEGLAEDQVPRWIDGRFAALGHKVTRDAAERLLLLVGPRLTVLAGEIEKTSLYVGPGQPVGVEDVGRAAAGGLGGTLEDLVNAVGERDLVRALTALSNALEVGEEPLRILGFLTYRITELWRIADGGRGWPAVQRHARNWRPTELAGAAAAIYSADRLLKGAGGGVPLGKRSGDRLILETLLRRIIGGGGWRERRSPPGPARRAAAGNRSRSRGQGQETLL